MQIPPIDVTRWALRALKLLDDAGRALFPQPPQPPRQSTKPETDRHTPPEIW